MFFGGKMEKKVGRNDPCPCGSGKKYKQCCLQKSDSAAKTYTATGKRKFKAKVIKVGEQGQALFQTAAAGAQPTMQLGKFKATSTDFRVRESKEALKFEMPQAPAQKPEEAPPEAALQGGEFKPTKKDFREKKKEQ